MAIDIELVPKTKRPAGERCCEPVVYPEVERDAAMRMAEAGKALGDPVRLQLVDVLKSMCEGSAVSERRERIVGGRSHSRTVLQRHRP